MLRVAFLIPLLPLAGFVILLAFGRKLGNPLAGWVATLMVAASFVVTVIVFAGLFQLPAGGRSYTADLVHVDLRRPPARRHGPARRPAVDDDGRLRDRRERAHPPLLDRLHGARRGLPEVLPLPEPVRRPRCCCSCSADNFLLMLPRLGGRRRLLVLPHRLLVRARQRRRARQEGDDLQPHRRRRLPRRPVPDLRAHRQPRVPDGLRPPRRTSASPRSSRSGCCCSSAPPASRPRSRSIPGWRTRWKARRRSRRSSTPRRW